MKWGENLAKISKADLPLLVLSDGARSVFGFLIKTHQRGFCSHCMWGYKIKDGELICASQGWTFKDVPLSHFLKTDYVKFWRSRDWDSRDQLVVNIEILRMLRRPWWKRRYDYIGILGQALKMRWINLWFRDYCSESVARPLRKIERAFTMKHPSPTDINKWCKEQPDFFVWDRWSPDV